MAVADPNGQMESLHSGDGEYRAIFEATGDGVIIADMQGHLVDVNPALCRMHGYGREEMLALHPTQFIHPAYHNVFAEYMRSLTEGHAYRAAALDVRKDGSVFPVEVNGAILTYRGRPHILGIVRDVSDRAFAEQQLQERESQYHAIFEATNDALIITDLDGFCVEANPAACRLYGYTHDELVGINAGEVTHPDYLALAASFMETVKAGGTIEAQSVNFRKDGTPFFIETRASQFTFLGKPHILAVVHDVTETVKARELLEQRVEERTRQLQALLGISRNVASSLEMETLLNQMLDGLADVVPYDRAAVLAGDGKDVAYLARRAPAAEPDPPYHVQPIIELVQQGDVVIIDDVRGDSPAAQAFRLHAQDVVEHERACIRSCLGAPIAFGNRRIGVLILTSDKPNFYTEHHAELALAVAQQAAVAMENARLYGQAQELAVLEERQRLSRELHDSVSQALYAIKMAAETTRVALHRDPDQVAKSVEMVRSLAQAGMAEMRALLFDLRPESLEVEGLTAALRKQCEAIESRHEIPVTTTLCQELDVSLPVKEALYRITQEALHNAVKHARASRLDVRLTCTTQELVLEVQDDGTGFDTTDTFPGHLGLHSMRERAAGIGSHLEVRSCAGKGTCVRARVPIAIPDHASSSYRG